MLITLPWRCIPPSQVLKQYSETFYLAVLIFWMTVMQHTTEGHRSTCHDPYDLEDRLYRSMGQGHSFSLNDTLRSFRRRNSTDVFFYGSNECPDRYQVLSGHTLQQRALCPWHNVMNFDQYRYPRVVAQARCTCRRCGSPLRSSRCEPVYAHIRVLRRSSSNVLCNKHGHYVYQEYWEKISIGCTCAVARSLN